MSKLLPWIKIGISIGLLGLIAFLLDWQKSLSLLRGTARSELALGLGLLLGAYLVNGVRLIQLQRRVALELPRALFWGAYYTGLLMNCVLPSGVGGDVARILIVRKQGYPLGELAATSLVDRFLGLLGLLAIAGVALIIVPGELPMTVLQSRVAGVALLLGSVLGLWWLPRLGITLLNRMGKNATSGFWQKIERGSDIFQQIFHRPRQMIFPALLSLTSHSLYILSYASLGQALLPEMSLSSYFLAIPGVMIVLLIPISLGGLGLREISTVGLLVWLGADQQEALTLSLLFLAIYWISVIPAILTAVHYGLGFATIKEYSDGP